MDGKSLRGLVLSLQSLFYPGYCWEEAKKGKSRSAPPGVKPKGNQTTGRERGLQVDRELTKCFAVMKSAGVEPAWLLYPQKYKTQWQTRVCFTNARDKAWMASLSVNMHPFTRTFLQTMVERDWLPEASQVMCGSVTARLGTAVDLVVYERGLPHHHILLEIKCGYYTTLRKHTGPMKPPYEQFNDCPLHQFMLQLSFTRMLYIRNKPRQAHCKAFVVVLHEYGKDVFPLLSTIVAHNATGWSKLLETRALSKAARKKRVLSATRRTKLKST